MGLPSFIIIVPGPPNSSSRSTQIVSIEYNRSLQYRSYQTPQLSLSCPLSLSLLNRRSEIRPPPRRDIRRPRLVDFVRFFTIQSALIRDKFPVARVPILGMALALGAVIVVLFAVILAVAK